MRENSATELTISTVHLPVGARADKWEPGRRLDRDETRAWRLVHGTERLVIDHDACVRLRAVQFSDGSLDDVEVTVEHGDDSFNSDQAREFAAALLEAAAETDKWAGR